MATNRIVSSTIVLPESTVAHATSGTKRSFDHSRHGSSGSSKDMDTTVDHESRRRQDSHENSTTTTTNTAAAADSESKPSTVTATESAGEVPAARTQDKTEDLEMGEIDERSNKRIRTAVAPTAEDAKRGRRMMGMILGTLTQFKKEQPRPTQAAASSSTADASSAIPAANAPPRVLNGAAGLASREAVQERVREKLRREHELHEKIRQQTLEERQQQRALGIARPIASALVRAGPLNRQNPRNQRNQQNNRTQWEHGYLFTETRPRLRYMPKVLNESLRQKVEEQKTKDQRIIDRRSNSALQSAATNTTQADESLRLAKEKAQAVADEEALGDVSMDIETGDLVVDIVPPAATETQSETALKSSGDEVSDSKEIPSEDSEMKEETVQDKDATPASDNPDLINISLV